VIESWSREYEAATNAGALVRLKDWSTVRATGADRAAFLHNMCTSDIRGLAPGANIETFFTDVKGKIVAHGFVFATDGCLQIALAPGQATTLVAHLDRYIVREDVQLADATAGVNWWIALGPRRGEVMDHVRTVVPDFANGFIVSPCLGLWPGADWVAIDTSQAMATISHSETTVELVSDAAWNAVRVESGWPLFGVDFDETNLPQEVGRDAVAINFRKGCYLGQETVARLDALGHVNKRLATVRIDADEPPAIRAELLADSQAVGRVTSACWSPRLGGPLALAMVRRGHNEAGAALTCGGASAAVVATPAVALAGRET